MTAAALVLVELDTNASIVEAAAKRVHLALHRGSMIAGAGVVCLYLHRAQNISDSLRKRLSEAEIQTDEDRATVRDIAASLGQGARAFEKAYCDARKRNVGRIPVFGPRVMAQLDDLSCALEDMAETAALAASEAFADAVCNELKRNLDDHARSHAIA
jgi:hypothetical protein